MSSDTPTEPGEPKKGFVREFFSDLNFVNWVEVILFAFFGLLFASYGVYWLINRF